MHVLLHFFKGFSMTKIDQEFENSPPRTKPYHGHVHMDISDSSQRDDTDDVHILNSRTSFGFGIENSETKESSGPQDLQQNPLYNDALIDKDEAVTITRGVKTVNFQVHETRESSLASTVPRQLSPGVSDIHVKQGLVNPDVSQSPSDSENEASV
jgi:hypothetical protein